LTQNKQNKNHAQIPYRFVVGKKVKNVYATPEQHTDLISGKLAIAYFSDISFIVPDKIARQVKTIDPTLFVYHPDLVDTPPSSPSSDSADEAYSEFEVPDDLIW
jgi:uncharacterized protein YaiL (DUF2058 family)